MKAKCFQPGVNLMGESTCTALTVGAARGGGDSAGGVAARGRAVQVDKNRLTKQVDKAG